jgi:MFS family permease
MAHAAGLLVLAFASAFWMVLAFAVLHGLGWGMRGPLMSAIRADYFGSAASGRSPACPRWCSWSA